MASAALISPASLGVVNRMRVLAALHASGPQSRAGLARTFGVSRATVGTILQPLLDSGVLVESEPLTPSRGGGKPPRPVWFSDSARAIGAVEIVPGRVTAARLAPTGAVRQRAERSFRLRTKDSDTFAAALAESCAEAFSSHEVIGVGVAAAGLVEPDDGRIVELTAAPALANYPLARAIGAITPAPVYLEHHARVQALGDRWFGAGRGIETFASVSTGDTVGVGIVHGGAVLSAPGAASGAHMTVDIGGTRCDCGKRGCWKTIATTAWLRRRAAALGVPGARGVTLARLTERADERSATLVDEYARNLAVGLGTVQQLLAPGVFILHGEAAAGGTDFLARLTRYLRAESPRRQGEYRPSVVAADPARDSALLGCAGLVLARGMEHLR
jgi:predicted NBD/HSP70 family sugar kinase